MLPEAHRHQTAVIFIAIEHAALMAASRAIEHAALMATSRANEHAATSAASSGANQHAATSAATSGANQHAATSAATSGANEQAATSAATSGANEHAATSAATSGAIQGTATRACGRSHRSHTRTRWFFRHGIWHGHFQAIRTWRTRGTFKPVYKRATSSACARGSLIWWRSFFCRWFRLSQLQAFRTAFGKGAAANAASTSARARAWGAQGTI